MSLSDIKALRLARQKPSGVIAVVMGQIPKTLRAEPLLIEVLDNCQTTLEDFRPLIGVWVSVYKIKGSNGSSATLLEALQKAGAKLFGIVEDKKVICLAKFDKKEDQRRAEWQMLKEWEMFCNS